MTLTQEVKQAVGFSIDCLQMVLDHGQEEAAPESCLIWEVVSCTRSRYYDLHFLDREGCLGKVRAVLSKDYLLLIEVLLGYIVHGVGYYCVVFFTSWNIPFVREARP